MGYSILYIILSKFHTVPNSIKVGHSIPYKILLKTVQSSILYRRAKSGLILTASLCPCNNACHALTVHPTLRASVSGTFLHTLPDLVTPLKGHAAVHGRGQRPPKGSGTNMTVEATKRPSTHVNMRRIHPGKKKSSISIQTILVLFELA